MRGKSLHCAAVAPARTGAAAAGRDGGTEKELVIIFMADPAKISLPGPRQLRHQPTAAVATEAM